MKTIKIKSRTYSNYIFNEMYFNRMVIFIVALTFIIGGCKKFDPVESATSSSNDPNTQPALLMGDLVVSDNFDWKLFQTIDVRIVLPEDQDLKPIRISSLDEEKVYFRGNSEDGSKKLVTLITIPAHVENVLVEFDNGSIYDPVIVPIINNSLNFDFNSSMKMGGRAMDPACCDGKVNWLTIEYLGADPIYIEVDGSGPGNNSLFSGNIVQGEEFTIYGNDNNNTLGSKVKIYKDNSDDKTEIHTSCSVDIYTGQTWSGDAGDYLIIAGESRLSGPLCPLPGGGNDDFTGSLAFEDLWPSKGDYDFNDLVINYGFSIVKNSSEQIEHITATFEVLAFGAGFENGFGFTFPNVDPDQIISVTGYDLEAGTYINLAANGTEVGQTEATFVVYDNTFRVMTHPGTGIGVNTEPSATYVTPVTIVVEIDFFENGNFGPGGPVTYSQLDIGNFNPFIIINEDRLNEVHLSNNAPSDLIDTSVFGTYEDDSDIGSSRYYLTETNLPWAINIPETFSYPKEKQDIVTAFLKFAEWAESEGTLYPDWYEDEPGYRNSSNIY